MSYLDTLYNTRGTGQGADGLAALTYPLWEQNVPQYPNPNTYNLAQNGYKQNELVYACINKWMKAIAEAPLKVYDNTGETPEELPQHALRQLIKKPNPYMSEKGFWRATQMWLKIAGFIAWEIEFNNLREPIALYPMSPHWCSFRRGPNVPIAWIEYRPYGVIMQPVPIERVLLFQYLDPLSPFVRALSPSAIASRVGAVDNNATDFLKLFWENGAVVNGLLSTEQPLQQAEAALIRKMWSEQHGGFRNWVDPAVIGQGVKYQQTQMDFRQMTFDNLDARNETRICQAFSMQPILVSAKVGLDRSTFSNYGEARKAQYEEEYLPEWDWLEAEAQNQLLPKFEDADTANETFLLDFDISQVHALQEDRTSKFTRATSAFEKNLMTRDEAREEMDLDPIDDDDIFYGDTVQATREALTGTITPGTDLATASTVPPGQTPAAAPATDALNAAQAQEVKRFQQFAANRKREGAPERIREFRFTFVSKAEQARLIEEAQDDTEPDTEGSVKKKRSAARKGPDHDARAKLERKAANVLKDAYAAQAKRITKVVRDALKEKEIKGGYDLTLQSYLLNLLDDALDEETNEIVQDVLPFYDDVLKAAAQEGADYLPVAVDYSKVNLAVLKLAQARARYFAEQSTDTSRAALSAIVENWISTGGTMADLIDRVGEVWEGKRPDLAAVNEVSQLFTDGNIAAWKESDVVEGYDVNTAEDTHVDEICVQMRDGGPYPLEDEEHKPQYHNGCRCWTTPKIKAVGKY